MSYPVQSNLDLTLNQLLNAVAQVLASAPATPTEGRFWYDSTTGKLSWRDGSGNRAVQRDDVRLDQIAAPTASVALNGQRITGVADPAGAQDAATKAYADALSAGLDFKDSVRAATTGNIALTGAQTIDGVAVVAGDRVLVKAQTAPAENGLYTAAAGAWSRAPDADSGAELSGGTFCFVEQGTTLADTGWVATHNGTPTLGTDAITFTQFSAAVISAIAKHAEDITGDAAVTQFTVTHNLATTDVTIAVYDVTADLEIIVDKKRPTANTARIDFAQAPANGKVYRVVVLG